MKKAHSRSAPREAVQHEGTKLSESRQKLKSNQTNREVKMIPEEGEEKG